MPASAPFEIIQLERTPGNVMRFLQVPYGIYEGDPYWVPPLLYDLKMVFLPGNPFLEHSEMEIWVARRNGRDVGRIAGILDKTYVRVQQSESVFFGFFECVNDAEVSRALFDAVYRWGRSKGMKKVLGPMNPSSNDECGLLIDGFDGRPVFMMPYNPRYYVELVEREGFVKAKDLLAFHMDLLNSPLDRFRRIAEKARARNPEITYRAVTKAGLHKDLPAIKEVYNQAWEANWGFVPMTDAEIDFMASRLKPLLVEGLAWLAESPEGPVGFLLATPDLNEGIHKLRGRLLSPRIFKFLPYALQWKIPTLGRAIIFGVKPKYRGLGIDSVMLAEGLEVGLRIGLKEAEASWILEDNVKMRRILELFGATAYRTYRLYDKDLPA